MTHAAAHHSITVISRGKGRSATAAAAYVAGTRIVDARTGLDHDYRRRSGVRCVEIVGHAGNPAELWNAAEAAETRLNACTARETILALPPAWQAALLRGHALAARPLRRRADDRDP
jgi:MobA/MobL family